MILGAAILSSMTVIAAQAGGTSTAVAVCQACHGVTGNSAKPDVPRLNGQKVEYLKQRLTDFHDPASQDPHATNVMWGIVERTDDSTLVELAQYFATQAPMAAANGGASAQEGRKLYTSGDPANYVPACGTCHGANAEGLGDVPRLAGQHGLYLENQLERMRLNMRANGVMHPKTNSMSDAQIKALVGYLAKD